METRYCIQWCPKGDGLTDADWLYFISYTEYDKALSRYKHLVEVNGHIFDYRIITTPDGAQVLV